MKRLIAVLAVLMMVMSMVCFAEPADDQAYIKEKGKLVIGITEYAPMNYYDETAILEDATLSGATYTPIANMAGCLMEIKAGTADAAVLDVVMANAMVGEGTDYDDLMIVDGIELAVEEYAIGFRLDSNMAAAADAIIDELYADGTLAALAEKYDLTAMLIAD